MDFALHIGFLEVTITDIIDILLVSYLLYQLYKIVRGNVAFRIALGVLAIYLTYMVVRALKMELLSAILGQFIGVGVLAAIILFQPEIRKFLQVLGKSAFANQDSLILSLFRKKTNPHDIDIKEVIEAAKSLSGTNTGALIAFTRNTDLKTYIESGDKLDAAISRRLLLSIFQKYS
ncbi:MAG: TIGR00159 family protein, partial [Chitinophagia bacterium]|nr:TIGR00159 family protein [Chitinophagia bacterium]